MKKSWLQSGLLRKTLGSDKYLANSSEAGKRIEMLSPMGTTCCPSKRSTAGGQMMESGSLKLAISIGTLVLTAYS